MASRVCTEDCHCHTLVAAKQSEIDRRAYESSELRGRLLNLVGTWREFAAIAESPNRADHWRRCANAIEACVENR